MSVFLVPLSSSKRLKFSSLRSFTSLIRLISRYFTLFFAVMNGSVSMLHSAVLASHERGQAATLFLKLLPFSVHTSISEVADSHLRSLQRTRKNSHPHVLFYSLRMWNQFLLSWFICPSEPRCFPHPREISFFCPLKVCFISWIDSILCYSWNLIGS